MLYVVGGIVDVVVRDEIFFVNLTQSLERGKFLQILDKFAIILRIFTKFG